MRHAAVLPEAVMPYSLRGIAARLSPEGEGLVLELQDFIVSGEVPPASPESRRAAVAERNIALFEKLLHGPWLDWLDYWSVGLLGDAPQAPVGAIRYDPPGGRADRRCARILWHSARRGKTPPELRAAIALNQNDNARLLVTLVDIFANESFLVLDLPQASCP